jgi:hypothetical protein
MPDLIPEIALIAIGLVLLVYNVVSRRIITRDQENLRTASVICREVIEFAENQLSDDETATLWQLTNEAQDLLYA